MSGVGVSIVIPAWNEEESIPELVNRCRRALEETGRSWEILFVDDGSTDRTFEVLQNLAREDGRVRLRSFLRNYGKSAALEVGFAEAQGAIIVTMDSDLQDDPGEIPALLARIDEGYDLVSGWKRVRRDPVSKTWPSKLFNAATSLVSGIKLHDFNCGLKAYRAEVAKGLPLYGEMHRFLPAIAHWQGYRVGEIPVVHHARKYGRSKFGAARFINGFLDLMTVTFVHSGKRSPLHVFGRVGLVLGLIGVGIFAGFAISWLTGQGVRTRPIFFIGLILIIVAMQFMSLGLLGELVVKGHTRPQYRFRDSEVGR